MGGYYTFRALDTGTGDGEQEFFRVPIADFELYVPEEQLLEDSRPNPAPRVLN